MSKESSVYETRMAIRLLAMPADAPLAALYRGWCRTRASRSVVPTSVSLGFSGSGVKGILGLRDTHGSQVPGNACGRAAGGIETDGVAGTVA